MTGPESFIVTTLVYWSGVSVLALIECIKTKGESWEVAATILSVGLLLGLTIIFLICF